jgi:hypothetical protein
MSCALFSVVNHVHRIGRFTPIRVGCWPVPARQLNITLTNNGGLLRR